jgi:hypothetical protein
MSPSFHRMSISGVQHIARVLLFHTPGKAKERLCNILLVFFLFFEVDPDQPI